MSAAARVSRRALPLRWRLVVAALVGAVGFAIGFAAFASWEIDRLESRSLGNALQDRLDLVRGEIRPDGTFATDSPSARTSLVEVLAPDGTVRDASPALRLQAPLVPLQEVLAAGPSGVRRGVELPHSHLTLLGAPLRMRASVSGPAGRGAVIVGLESEGFRAAHDQLRYVLLVGFGVVVPLAGLLAWLLAGRALRTVTTLTEEAEAVGVSDIGRGLAVPASDPELSRLVGALNRMLGRVADGLEHERRFAADASHRLRTPLATLRAEAELALAEGDPAGMRHSLEQVIADADNLTALVNRLLASHRRNPGDVQPLHAVADASVARWRRQAEAAGLELRFSPGAVLAQQPPAGGAALPGGVANGAAGDGAAADDGVSPAGEGRTCPRIDPHVLRAVLDPLVENAVQHTDSGGTVAVRIDLDGADVTAEVCDTGHGVSPEVGDRLFRPWTTTRSEQGGAGLGLWLARESARAAGGDVVLVDDRPGRTTFSVRLPLA